MLVPAGFTNTTRRPALSALAVRMAANCAQPASRIAVWSPAFATAMFGRKVPGLGRVRLRARPTGHVGGVEFFQGDHVAGIHQGACGLVVEVAVPVADLAPFLGQGAAEPLAVPRAAARP